MSGDYLNWLLRQGEIPWGKDSPEALHGLSGLQGRAGDQRGGKGDGIELDRGREGKILARLDRRLMEERRKRHGDVANSYLKG
ncbi:MAG: hypothetical protein FJ276_22955 [Planctomycetes bacterium]|nr:hypothetical protein [Planctomycetota bacterium]